MKKNLFTRYRIENNYFCQSFNQGSFSNTKRKYKRRKIKSHENFSNKVAVKERKKINAITYTIITMFSKKTLVLLFKLSIAVLISVF